MTPDDLGILIQEGEGTTLEFKESLSSSFARELVALANTIERRPISPPTREFYRT